MKPRYYLRWFSELHSISCNSTPVISLRKSLVFARISSPSRQCVMTVFVEYQENFFGFEGLVFIRFYQVFKLNLESVCINIFLFDNSALWRSSYFNNLYNFLSHLFSWRQVAQDLLCRYFCSSKTSWTSVVMKLSYYLWWFSELHSICCNSTPVISLRKSLVFARISSPSRQCVITVFVEYQEKFFGFEGLVFIRFYQVFILNLESVCIKIFTCDNPASWRSSYFNTLYDFLSHFLRWRHVTNICYVDISVQVKHRGQ